MGDQRIERDEQVQVGRGDIHQGDILYEEHAFDSCAGASQS